MDDSELSQTFDTPSNSPWFILASCFVQLLPPPAGLTLFDLTYSNYDGFTAITFAIALVKAIPSTWQLAVEPLLLAIFLVAMSSTIPNRRIAITILVLITVLNVIASGMLIVGRSL